MRGGALAPPMDEPPLIGTSIAGLRMHASLIHHIISHYITLHTTSINYPSPKKMAKGKVEFENRSFQDRWEAQYMYADVNGKAVCLLCGDSVAVMKEYSIRARSHQTRLLKAQPLQKRLGQNSAL